MESPQTHDPRTDPFVGADSLPTLWGWGLRLRWLTEEDLGDLFAVFSDPEVVRYMTIPLQRTEEDTRRFLDSVHQGFRDGSLYEWGIEHDGRIVGIGCLSSIDRTHRRAEVGFALGRAAWGKRLMSEALPLLITFAFWELQLHRLEADADPRNAASIRILERFGFQREGYMRERYCVDGEFQDGVFYGLLREEWGRENRPHDSDQ